MDIQSSSLAVEQTTQSRHLSNFSRSEPTNLTYRYWRLRIMYSLIFGYATFYLIRTNFSMAIPAICEQFGYTNTQLGFVATLFSIVYGIGKFVNGYLSDHSNARYFMTIGMVGAALANLFMGWGESLLYFSLFWIVNAWFQSMAWPPCGRLLTHWFSPKELGTKWGLWNSSHQIGAATIFILAGFLIENYGWHTAFFIPACVSLGIAFLLFNRLRDTPKSLGLPPVEVYKGLTEHPEDAEEESLSYKEMISRVLGNKLLWYVCLGNMFLYVVRIGFVTWAPAFLKELKQSSLLTSGLQMAGFEIAGLLGGICAGWLSDKIFHGRRGPVSVFYMLALVLALLYFWQVPQGQTIFNAIAMIAVGFMVYGPQVLVGVAAADFSSKKAVGLATGLTGSFGYLGGSMSGIGVGYIADRWGWNGGMIFFMVCALLGVMCFALTWKHRARVLDQS